MMGVNIDNLDTLVKKNNLYFDSYYSNSKKLINCINELNECYEGKSLGYLFCEPLNEIKNLQVIPNVIKSYSNVLVGVKTGYQQQDKIFKTQIDHINSNL